MRSYLLEAVDTVTGRAVASQELVGATLADLAERAREIRERLGGDVQVEARRLDGRRAPTSPMVWVIA